VREFGMAKEGLIARQFMLGVVQTAEGLPIRQRQAAWPVSDNYLGRSTGVIVTGYEVIFDVAPS